MEKSALVYVFLSIITVGLGFFVKNERYMQQYLMGTKSKGMDRQQAENTIVEIAVFLLLTGVSACRIAIGNDYWPYRFNFRLIAQERHVSSELGFNLIVKGMQDLFGYDNYLPIFALFSFLTVLFFAMALHDQAFDYKMSLFLLMTGGFYFNSLNSVRYYMALAMALFSMKYVLRGEYGKFVLLILAGAMFHKSILLVIPVYIAAKILAVVNLKKWQYIAGAVLTATVIIFGKTIVREIIFFFYPYYRNSDFDNGSISYVNILKCAAVIGMCLIFGRKSILSDVQNRFYFFLNLFCVAVYFCGSFIPEISRVGYYMMVSQIFLIPKILSEMENTVQRRICYTGVILGFSAYFVFMLRGMYAVDIRLLPYLNWIFN